jgi:inner membrane protein
VDPLTQGLLGASFGQALCGRALGRHALVAGALVGMAPDLDVVANVSGPLGEWLWHRGVTHSLWFGPVTGPLVGYGLWRWKGGSLPAWVTLALAALFTHPLLDLFTSYGTQLFAPFSNRRFALDAVAIIDPAYSLVLAGGILIGLRAGLATRAARRAAWAALVVTSLYLALGLVVNERVESLARRQLGARGIAVSRVAAYPTLLQLPYRRVVARSGDDVRVGWLSLLRPREVEWESFTQARHPLVDAARATREVEVLEWFAMGEATPRVERAGDGTSLVEFDDLRYGFPGAPRDGLWGVRVRLDGAGRPLGPGERFDRALPAPASRLLLTIWRETLGLS